MEGPSDQTEDELEEKALEEAEKTMENLKKIDLSTSEGRVAVAQACHFVGSELSYEGAKDEYGQSESLSEIIQNSIESEGGRNGRIISVNKNNLLSEFIDIKNFYGHNLVKRNWFLAAFIAGRDYNSKEDKDIIEKTDQEADRFL